MNELFNITYFGRYRRYPETTASHRIPLDTTREIKRYHLEFYLSDEGTSYVNDCEYKNRIGNVLLVKPGDTRKSLGLYECYCIHFDCTNYQFEEEFISQLPACIYAPKTEKLFSAAVSAFEISQLSDKSNILMMNGAILNIFSDLHKILNSGAPAHARQYTEKDYAYEIGKCTEYIKNHFTEDIQIETLYKNVFMSKTTFFKYFKKFTSKTPSEYINGVRISFAQELFLSSDYTLSQVAHMSGFSSQNYFNHIFKKTVSLTPTEYKMWVKKQKCGE